MLKTASFLLCSVAILVSGADNAANNLLGVESPSNPTSQITEKLITSSTPINPTTLSSTTSISSTSDSITTSSSTTTTSPPPNPTPTPDPGTRTWVVDGTTDTCIIVTMALQFKLTYNTTANKTAQITLNLPTNNRTKVQGTCGNATDLEQNLTLTWQSEIIYAKALYAVPNNLTLHFVKNTTNKQYSLHHIELYLIPEEFPNIQSNYSTSFVHKSNLFTTALGNSYRCLRVQTLNITHVDDKNKIDKIEVSHLQFQAFHAGNTTHFGFAEDCAFDTPDIVPIAVGCALATLVVFVLIAYLAARRHSQARGYLSM